MLAQAHLCLSLLVVATIGLLPGLPACTGGDPLPDTPAPVRQGMPSGPLVPPAGTYLFGTLLSDPTRAAEEYAAGVRVVHLELGWDAYEPQEGVFDPAYIAQTWARLSAFEAAGLRVVLGVGLQYPPAWAYDYPGSRYVDQSGAAAGPLNLTFNQSLRDRAARYIARVHSDFDLNRFWAVRVGAGGIIETLYPAEDAAGGTNSYWAYDAAAQGGAGRPPSIPPAPYPGWRPGETTYNGDPFAPDRVRDWLAWYIGALVDTVNWQLDTYRGLGYVGYQQVLLPGVGTKPAEYEAAVAVHLASNPNRTLGRGAVWDRIIAGLRPERNVIVYISSMAEGSGGDDRCEPGDRVLEPGDAQIIAWSSTRWIAYNAQRSGLATMGENPGQRDTGNYSVAMLQLALQQMTSCAMLGFMWAHSAELHQPSSGVTLDDYAAAIRRFGGLGPR